MTRPQHRPAKARPTWRNAKSAAQWEASLRDYAYPVLGDMRVDEIGSGDVLRVLRPIWNVKRETAQRVRQRISAVMKAAIADGHRPDDPAGDALTAALPKGGQKQRHQRALPHRQVARHSRPCVGRTRRHRRSWPSSS